MAISGDVPHIYAGQNEEREKWLTAFMWTWMCWNPCKTGVAGLQPLLEFMHSESKRVLHCSTTGQKETFFYIICICTKSIIDFQAFEKWLKYSDWNIVTALQSYTCVSRLVISCTFKTWGVFGFASFLNNFKYNFSTVSVGLWKLISYFSACHNIFLFCDFSTEDSGRT